MFLLIFEKKKEPDRANDILKLDTKIIFIKILLLSDQTYQ